MKLGLHIRNSGPFATRELIADCARLADAEPTIDDLWLFDHVAIPPDQAEGSEGIYVDPLATLAFLAGITERVGLGTRVLILPYRPALPTAKWVASIQELSGGRLHLGVGVGWMEEEFRALGVDRSRRGKITDETLEVIHRCFSGDEVELSGQTLLFKPRPTRPPIFVGGAAPQALARAARYGDGWAAQSADVEDLAGKITELADLFERAGKSIPEVLVPLSAPADEIASLADRIGSLAEIGATRIPLVVRYETASEFERIVEAIAGLADS